MHENFHLNYLSVIKNPSPVFSKNPCRKVMQQVNYKATNI